MSFSDMMSSGRGPGVIGMILALIVLLGFGLLFMFAFDDGLQGANQSIESRIAHDDKEIVNLTNMLEKGNKDLAMIPQRQTQAKKLSSMKTENRIRDGGLESLKKGITTVNQAIAEKHQQFETYKNDYRTFIRGKAKGQNIAHLVTLKGGPYENVTIREVTPVGMQVLHSGGQKRIPYEELPLDLQDLYQFDPAQKAEAVAKEDAMRNEHESAVSAAQETENQLAAEQKAKDADEARKKTIRTLGMKKSRIESLGREIESLQRAIPMEALKSISNAPQMRGQLARKQQELDALRNDVSALENMLN